MLFLFSVFISLSIWCSFLHCLYDDHSINKFNNVSSNIVKLGILSPIRSHFYENTVLCKSFVYIFDYNSNKIFGILCNLPVWISALWLHCVLSILILLMTFPKVWLYKYHRKPLFFLRRLIWYKNLNSLWNCMHKFILIFAWGDCIASESYKWPDFFTF